MRTTPRTAAAISICPLLTVTGSRAPSSWRPAVPGQRRHPGRSESLQGDVFVDMKLNAGLKREFSLGSDPAKAGRESLRVVPAAATFPAHQGANSAPSDFRGLGGPRGYA